jgi:hypothetical protein
MADSTKLAAALAHYRGEERRRDDVTVLDSSAGDAGGVDARKGLLGFRPNCNVPSSPNTAM